MPSNLLYFMTVKENELSLVPIQDFCTFCCLFGVSMEVMGRSFHRVVSGSFSKFEIFELEN
jgi:hypothetical protein